MTMSLPASAPALEVPVSANADSGEIAKFEALAARWWDPGCISIDADLVLLSEQAHLFLIGKKERNGLQSLDFLS